MKNRTPRTQRGFSLVEVLISVGLMSIMAIIFTSVLTNYHKSINWLAQKGDAVDLKNQMMSTLNNPTICSCQVNPNLTADNSNDSNLSFNSNTTSGAASMNMIRIRSGCGATDPIVAEAGQRLSNGLRVASVTLANLRPATSPATTAWLGDFTVTFDQGSDSLPIRPVTMTSRLTLATPYPSTSQIILACSAFSGLVIDWVPATGSITSANTFCMSAGYAGSTGLCRKRIGSSNPPNFSQGSCWVNGSEQGMLVYEQDGGSGDRYRAYYERITGSSFSVQCFR